MPAGMFAHAADATETRKGKVVAKDAGCAGGEVIDQAGTGEDAAAGIGIEGEGKLRFVEVEMGVDDRIADEKEAVVS